MEEPQVEEPQILRLAQYPDSLVGVDVDEFDAHEAGVEDEIGGLVEDDVVVAEKTGLFDIFVVRYFPVEIHRRENLFFGLKNLN